MADKFGEIVMRAWDDADFKARLLADPTSVLKEAGMDVPDGMEISIVEDTAEKRTFILPPAPTGELSEDELTNVAGGAAYTDPGFAPGRAYTDPGFAPGRAYTDPGFAPGRARGGDDIKRK